MAPRPAILASALILSILALSAGSAAAQGPIFATLTGPSALAPSQSARYNLTIAGGPTGAVTYSVRWHVTGADIAGALPAESNPTTATQNTTTFKLNVTAPPRDATMTLIVRVSAQLGTTYENTSVEKAIVVITPITLAATFRNDGAIAAVNVTVRFYVDDGFVGSRKIGRIEPRGTVTESFNYLPVGLQPGIHRVRIEADMDSNGVIDSSRGELVTSEVFYRYTPSLGTGWTILIGVGVFFPILVVTAAVRRRQRA